jgi:hypothetical protein
MSAEALERYQTRVPFRSVMEGVRIDEELARKASVVHPIASANLAPSANLEEVRHRRDRAAGQKRVGSWPREW